MATPDNVRKLWQTIEVDDYSQQFLQYCQEQDYVVTVLSDGFDFNIGMIFARYRIKLPYYADGLVYQAGHFRMVCHHNKPECAHCAT